MRRAAPPAPARPPAILSLGDIAALPRDVVEAACRAVASPVYLGGGVGLCRLLTRYKFHVATDDVGFGANVLLDGYWESWLTRFIARTVRRGQTVVDVGANCGYYSLLLADLVGPEGRLFAVEPNPAMADLLARSISLNGFAGRTEICRVALGAEEGGTARLAIPEREPKNASIVSADTGGEGCEVPLRRLDALVGAGTQVGFIKVDAEGAEEAIFEGMAGLLPQRPPMVLEFNAARYDLPGRFLDRLTGAYGALRYVDYDGLSAAVTPHRLLSDNFGEDWLLVLGCE
ncbi:MAG: FkbM family methyltransferase [Alphaproteobacteria bacterium]|nr:FkbM family methyltransferase [Alphaproteobacteria bacterium]